MTSFYHFLYKITCQVSFRYDITSRLTKDLGMRIRPRLRNPSKGLERVLLYWTSRHTVEESISFPEPTCPLVSTKTRSSGIIRGSSRVLSIMPNWPVRDQWEYLRKMERHFLIKSGQPIEMAVVISNHSLLPNFLIRAKNRFVKNGIANFGRSIPTEICGPPPEVIPNIPVRRNRNELFHLNFDRNYRNLWHNGKHPNNQQSRSQTRSQSPRLFLLKFDTAVLSKPNFDFPSFSSPYWMPLGNASTSTSSLDAM